MIKKRLNELKSIFNGKRANISYPTVCYEEFLKQDERAKQIIQKLHQDARKQNKNNILIAIREDPRLQSYQKELENRYYHFLASKENNHS